jgi:hypothetical protein
MLVYFSFQKELIYVLFYIVFYSLVYVFVPIDYMDFTETFVIIFYFIEKCLSKNSTETSDVKHNNVSLEIIILIISCLIFKGVFDYETDFLLFSDKYQFLEENAMIILFLFLLNLIIFKKHFYSHHFISMNIVIIIIIFIRYESTIELSYIIFILKYYSFSFNLLLIKYINTKYFVNIYLLGSIIGLSTAIQEIIMYFDEDIEFSFSFSFFIYFFLYLGKNFLKYKIISNLDSIHYFITFYIIQSIFDFTLDLHIIYIILNIFLILSGLVYLEILVLNFCGLSKNIRENIEKRGIEDFDYELHQRKILLSLT